MSILAEIIYALLLVVLISIISLSFVTLNEILDTGQQLFQREYRLHRCGAYLAAEANLHRSIDVILHYRPKLQVTHLDTMVHNFTRNYPRGICFDSDLDLQVMIYRQDNDQLPEFWPNYAVKFSHYRH